MTDRATYRDLGMDRRIPRRDFLSGVAIGIASGAMAVRSSGVLASAGPAAQPDTSAPTYPPARTGLRGNYPDAVREFPAMQGGAYRQFPAVDVDTGEAYDLVIVGGGVFFDKEHFGEDRLVSGNGRIPWPEFFAKAPLSETVRNDLVRLHGQNPDYMAGTAVEQKLAALAAMSWQDFLLKHAKVHPD